ncbi:MAG: pyridoxal phosphate-dependent aminotransferase family protein [Chitinophagales bacterium]|nr:pyridoxal phosphate-dependent aminotransferase family protein [Bacteroidota bacterium]
MIKEKLQKRILTGNYRQLNTLNPKLIDFSSNDYLGFGKNKQLIGRFRQALETKPKLWEGTCSARLIAGNHPIFEETESYLSQVFKADACLLFNSGYTANLGVFSSVVTRFDVVLYDEYVHASIRDGIRLSYAQAISFKHNDMDDLAQKLSSLYNKTVYVAVESLYSMDGDFCPLPELVYICEKFGAKIIIDEAHATGTSGINGLGLVENYHFEDRVFIRIHTFGKAMGAQGAMVLGSIELKKYLINFARPFIYTTAASPMEVLRIQLAVRFFLENPKHLKKLRKNVQYFMDIRKGVPNFLPVNSSIQCLMLQGTELEKIRVMQIQEKFSIKPILYPTVPQEKERIRICIHSFNTKKQLDNLLKCLTLPI